MAEKMHTLVTVVKLGFGTQIFLMDFGRDGSEP